MCESCWRDEYGAPTELPNNAEEILALFTELYAQSDAGAGGPLHVQIDDFNVDESWTPWNGGGTVKWKRKTWKIACAIQELVEPLPVHLRAALVATHWDIIPREESS